GHDLVASLRQRSDLDGCRFIAATGYVGAEVVERSLAAGFETQLTKPLHLAHLLGLLANKQG
ncbi:MAG: two-component system sensor histidine kinase/response regulator, partial [Polyangiaceae bacterium]